MNQPWLHTNHYFTERLNNWTSGRGSPLHKSAQKAVDEERNRTFTPRGFRRSALAASTAPERVSDVWDQPSAALKKVVPPEAFGLDGVTAPATPNEDDTAAPRKAKAPVNMNTPPSWRPLKPLAASAMKSLQGTNFMTFMPSPPGEAPSSPFSPRNRRKPPSQKLRATFAPEPERRCWPLSTDTGRMDREIALMRQKTAKVHRAEEQWSLDPNLSLAFGLGLNEGETGKRHRGRQFDPHRSQDFGDLDFPSAGNHYSNSPHSGSARGGRTSGWTGSSAATARAGLPELTEAGRANWERALTERQHTRSFLADLTMEGGRHHAKGKDAMGGSNSGSSAKAVVELPASIPHNWLVAEQPSLSEVHVGRPQSPRSLRAERRRQNGTYGRAAPWGI